MTTLQTNLNNLRAYPLTADGSVAHVNVEKLRDFSISTNDIRRLFFVPSYSLTASLSRAPHRSFATVQIP